VGLAVARFTRRQTPRRLLDANSTIRTSLASGCYRIRGAPNSENNRKSFWTSRLAMRQALFDPHPQKTGGLAVSSSSILKISMDDERQGTHRVFGLHRSRRNTGVALVAKHDDDSNGCSNSPLIEIGGDDKREASIGVWLAKY
jgi:hypothetical protein